MKTPPRILTCLVLFFAYNLLLGCDKEKLRESIANSGPCYCYGNNLTFFNVTIKKVNNFPAGSKILVEKIGHPQTDPSTINTYNIFTQTLPFKDTTLIQAESKNYSQYLKWKIVNANNDSLSGGITPKLTTGSNSINFDINY